MRQACCFLLFGVLLSGAASAAERLWFDGRQLELRAQTRACYLGFIDLYDVDYFRGPAQASCVRLSYLRGFDAETLGEATRKVFADRHGDRLGSRYEAELEQVAAAYRAVEPGDQYTYCLEPDGTGALLRDDLPALQMASPDFARRFLQIWVQGEDASGEPRWSFGSC